MLRKAKDQLRDRIKPQGVPNFRAGLRNAGRPGAGSHAKPKTGMSLQYKSLQPDPEFEAVLDDIHTSSNPLFAVSEAPNSNASQSISKSKSGAPGKQARKSAANSEPFFPESDEEEDDVRGQSKTGMDPLLGQVLIPETDSGHTDSDESEDQLELDAETVNVLESLHLADKVQDDLFGGESLSRSWSHDKEGSKERVEQSIQEESGANSVEETTSNKTPNTVHVQSLEEVGETLPHNEPSLPSRQPGSAGIPIVMNSNSNTHLSQSEDSKNVDEIRPPSPSLDDLLERGSAALHSHRYSPLYGSPHSPHSSLPEFSPSPLMSSNETETNEPFYSVTDQLYPSAARDSQSISPAEPQILINSNDQIHTDPDEIESSRRMDTGEKVVLEEAAVDTDATAHQPSPIDIAPEKQARRHLFVEEKDVLGLSPTSDHPLDQSDDGEAGLVTEKDTLTCTGKPHMPDSEDELFPDDSKHLQDFVAKEKSSATKSKNTLDITEDYFSSSPGEQRKKKAPPRPSPPAISRQNTSGKVAPPRPPRSPQLTARLKLRQNKVPLKTKSPVTVHSPSTQNSVIERARVNLAKTLDSAPTGMPANISNTNVYPPKVVQMRSHEDQETPPLDSSVSPPPVPTVMTEAVGTPQQDDIDLDDKAAEIDFTQPAFFPLHIHLLLVGILYIYYSFNPFVYLAGLMAGFLTFYLLLGAVFVLYVQNEEEVASSAESPIPELSPDFMKSMSVRLEDYKNRFMTRKFTATLQYDLATHHRRDRMGCDLKLIDDFKLHILVWTSDSEVVLRETYDLYKENCRITIVPQDVFLNRKRRWSKKYPIRIEINDFEFFLFSDTSRKKEEWFRRLREAADGTTTQQLIEGQKFFFQYMQLYFPHEPLRPTYGPSLRASASSTTRSTGVPSRNQQRRQKSNVGSVQFSNSTSREDFDDGTISISKSKSSTSQPDHATSITSSMSSVSSYGVSSPNEHHEIHHTSKTSDGRAPSVSSAHSFSINSVSDYVVTSQPVSSPLETIDWINVLAARLCWDVWNEQRWKEWIMCRIQKKLVRIKTPGFLESLELTDIEIGNKMPVVNRLYEGPYVNVDGVWVYLDVMYQGLFVMTIKTKLKLGQRQEEEEKGTEMKFVKHASSTKSGGSGVLSHSQAAQAFQYSSVDPDDDSDTGSDEETTHTLISPMDSEGLPPARPPPPQASALLTSKKKERRAKLKSVVTRITKKVASTRLVRKAAERVSSVPLELTVEVKTLRGILAVNIPPPRSDTIWYGFKETPKLELVAKPRLGKKAVTLSQVTHWIERKLCSLVDEKLTLPNMEDLVIPILNSGLPEDTQKPLSSPNLNT